MVFPAHLHAHALTTADAGRVVDLCNAYARFIDGADEDSIESVCAEWAVPDFDPAQDALLLVDSRSGRDVAYADIYDIKHPYVRKYAYAKLHPDYFNDQEVSSAVQDWILRRARERIALVPDESLRVVLGQFANERDQTANQLLKQRGYSYTRSTFQMLLEMDAPPPAPHTPEGYQLRPMQDFEREFHPILHAHRDAFRDHYSYVEEPWEKFEARLRAWVASKKNFDPSLWFSALKDERVAGYVTCSVGVPEDPDTCEVHWFGVCRSDRRRGLGLALLHNLFGELYRRGHRRVVLYVDGNSITGATRVYQRAGMHVHRQYNFYESELRPGVEISRQYS
jgi:mycothiol synthase